MANVVVSTTSPMAGRRLLRDVNRLLASGYHIVADENMANLNVRFEGPLGSIYQGGVWTVNLSMPLEYPLKAPRVRFVTKILHPNIEFTSGLVCLNAFKQAWSASYDLVNIFDTFLPQLLRHPNPHDPLNHRAAAIMKHSEQLFREHVMVCVKMYALPLPSDPRNLVEEGLEKHSSDLSLSDLLSDDDEDEGDRAGSGAGAGDSACGDSANAPDPGDGPAPGPGAGDAAAAGSDC
ncbi:ubiquitin-conjugating enzyme E2 H [Drosophila kikkawai]|uniref:Ubiquitin-conjugating enzyme E2 H n=1 Tax=Drosophila kikkawai TaxID=30033 RepID=A0A6P4JS64_DROKI|nr:ubiquitin-conjugating enzyme E2 H [Drosophila kikkawai]